jgi:ABC-type uncharacterized transport system ATPase subunit
LLASHVLSDLSEHCERVHVLLAGRIVTSGPPLELNRGRRSLAELYRSLERAGAERRAEHGA